MFCRYLCAWIIVIVCFILFWEFFFSSVKENHNLKTIKLLNKKSTPHDQVFKSDLILPNKTNDPTSTFTSTFSTSPHSHAFTNFTSSNFSSPIDNVIEPLSDTFLKQLHSNIESVNLNLTTAPKYCMPPTTLANCRLNWSMIIADMNKNVAHMSKNKSEYCFALRNEVTCFRSVAGGKLVVILTKVLYEPGTTDVITEEQKLIATYVYALNPVEYVLLLSNTKPDEFCFLSLYSHHCQLFHDLSQSNTFEHN